MFAVEGSSDFPPTIERLSYQGDICTGYPTRKRRAIRNPRRGCSRQQIAYPPDRISEPGRANVPASA